MTYDHAESTGEAFVEKTDSPAAVAAWWIGAFAAGVGILAIAIALSREPASAPAPATVQGLVTVPPGMTVARSTGPTADRGKPEAVRDAEQASMAAMRESARVGESIVYPPPPIPLPQ